MNPARRRWLAALAGAGAGSVGAGDAPAGRPTSTAEPRSRPDRVRRGRPIVLPRDHGAHPDSRIEWWYATGWLGPSPTAEDSALVGFQVTFFRARTGLAETFLSRFAPRHLLFAHAAVSDIGARRHQHTERLSRWSGRHQEDARERAGLDDADLAVGGWWLRRVSAPGPAPGTTTHSLWRTRIEGDGFGFALDLASTQPLVLQGEAGFSRKGPDENQASHYLSDPQLAVQGQLVSEGRTRPVVGRAWLDHEWSDELLHPQAVGWDWIGINLFDGSALTAFRLRRADGTALWAGGSWRPAPSGQPARPDGVLTVYTPESVRFEPGRRWRSPRSNADYPVEWGITTPTGRFTVRALMDAQELAGSATGTVYWEGLSELRDAAGRRVGLGYLEMTGYAGPLRLLGD